jgi:hypothetical protein
MRHPTPAAPPARTRRPYGALGLLALVVGLSGLAVWPMIEQVFARMFGPPGIEGREVFAPGDPARTFDHGEWTALLQDLVDDAGYVDYGRLFADPSRLDGYLTALANADFDALGRDEKLALLINAYNALTVRTVVDHWPLASVRAIPDGPDGRDRPWVVGGARLGLGELEQDWLRAKFREPRIHFAINPAALGAAPLRREAYVGARLDAQLDEQTRRVFADPRTCVLLAEGGTLRLTQICLWFASDFRQVEGTLLAFVRRHAPAVDAYCAAQGTPRVTWIDYDWRLNDRSNRPR